MNFRVCGCLWIMGGDSRFVKVSGILVGVWGGGFERKEDREYVDFF